MFEREDYDSYNADYTARRGIQRELKKVLFLVPKMQTREEKVKQETHLQNIINKLFYLYLLINFLACLLK